MLKELLHGGAGLCGREKAEENGGRVSESLGKEDLAMVLNVKQNLPKFQPKWNSKWRIEASTRGAMKEGWA